MSDEVASLVHRVIGGDAAAATEIRARAERSTSPSLLVAAALIADEPGRFLARAAELAVTTRDRQLVAIAAAHLENDENLLDALVRDHLSDHPDNVLAAWIASHHARPTPPTHSRQ